jgi:hypothetical protein
MNKIKLIEALERIIQEVRGSSFEEPFILNPTQKSIYDIIQENRKKHLREEVYRQYPNNYTFDFRTFLFKMPRCSGKTALCEYLEDTEDNVVIFSKHRRYKVGRYTSMDFTDKLVLFDEYKEEDIFSFLEKNKNNVVLGKDTLIIGVYT